MNGPASSPELMAMMNSLPPEALAALARLLSGASDADLLRELPATPVLGLLRPVGTDFARLGAPVITHNADTTEAAINSLLLPVIRTSYLATEAGISATAAAVVPGLAACSLTNKHPARSLMARADIWTWAKISPTAEHSLAYIEARVDRPSARMQIGLRRNNPTSESYGSLSGTSFALIAPGETATATGLAWKIGNQNFSVHFTRLTLTAVGYTDAAAIPFDARDGLARPAEDGTG